MSMTLLDSIMSFQLTARGLPAPVEKTDLGVPQPDANYSGGVAASTITSLSGLGQLLVASSTLGDQLTGTTSDQPGGTVGAVASSNSAVAAASVTDSSLVSAGTYAVSVTQLAQSQIQQSIFFVDNNTDYFGAGSLQLQTGQGTFNVSATSGSLNGLADAINASGAGVNAAVASVPVSGYRLTLTAGQTGTANGFTLVAPTGDPFNILASNFSNLGMANAQTATNATFSVNAGPSQSSASNSAVALAAGTTINLNGIGASTITASTTPTGSVSYGGLLSTANAFLSQYNAFQSTLNQLVGTGGLLNGNTVANTLQTNVSAIGTGGIATGLGLSAAAVPNTLQLNAATLSAAYAADPTTTINNLNSLVSSLKALAQNTTTATGAGSLRNEATTITANVRSGITSTLAGATSPVPTWITDVLTNHAVTSLSGTVPFDGFSTYV